MVKTYAGLSELEGERANFSTSARDYRRRGLNCHRMSRRTGGDEEGTGADVHGVCYEHHQHNRPLIFTQEQQKASRKRS